MSDPKWINNDAGAPAYDAAELRRLDSMLLVKDGDRFGARQGIHPANDPAVTLSGTTWTVEHITGVVYPGLSALDGPYTFAHPSESAALNPADATNPRLDALDLQVQDDDHDASGFRRARVVYVVGTPAASPVAPAVTANSLRLATILVPAGGSPSPSIDSLAVFTVAAGGVLPVRGTSELPTAGRYEGMIAYRQDTDTLEVWDGSVWVPIAGPGASPATVQDFDDTSLYTFTNTSFGVTIAGGTYSDCGVAFVAPITGRVKIEWNTAIDITSGTGAAAYISPVVRTGSVVGSGSPVLPAADANSRRVSRSTVGVDDGASRNRAGASYLLSGLTPAGLYNVRLEHRVTSQTGEAFHRSVIVAPAT